jgi:ABC-type sulfate transport system substrate-binding protein
MDTIIIEEPFSDTAVLDLRQAVNRLRDLLASVDVEAADAWRVADAFDNGYGGVLRGHEGEVVEAAEALSSEVFQLEEALPEISRLLDRIVDEGYRELLPEDE